MSQTACPWCARPFTPSRKAFGVFCSRLCADAELGATSQEVARRQQRAASFHSVQSRLHALNLPGARIATASEQTSFRRADAEARS